MVFFVSQLAQTGGFTERYHLSLFHFIIWCSTRIRTRPVFFTLYDSSWLSYIQEFFGSSSVCWWCCWWHSTVHFVQTGWFSPIFRNSFLSRQWHCFLDTHNNKLMLNPSKTELLLIGTSRQRKKLSDVTSISLGNTTFPLSTSARNLSFIFNSDMSLTSWVNLVCESSSQRSPLALYHSTDWV